MGSLRRRRVIPNNQRFHSHDVLQKNRFDWEGERLRNPGRLVFARTMTAPVRLTLLERSEADDLFPMWMDAETIQFTNWPLLFTREDCLERLAKMTQKYQPGSGRFGPYVIRRGDGGFVGLVGADLPEASGQRHELWYALQRDQWGKGYAGQAIAGFLAVLASAEGVQKITASSVSGNVASCRLLEKNGFVLILTITDGFVRNGMRYDLHYYERDLKGPCALPQAAARG